MIDKVQNYSRQTKLIVKNNSNEGVFQLNTQDLDLLTKSKVKTLISVLLILITGGIFGILLVWFPYLRKISFYKKLNIEEKQFIGNMKKLKESITHISINFKNQDQDLNQGQVKKNGFFNMLNQVVIIEEVIENDYFNYIKLKYNISCEDNNLVISPIIGYQQQLSLKQIQQFNLISSCLDQNQIQELQKQFGKCILETEKPNFLIYFGTELISIPFILQYVCALVWISRGIYVLGIMLTAFSIIFTIINYFVFILPSYKKLQEKITISENVTVIRQSNNQVSQITINSVDIVPGDIIILKQNLKIPCDTVLLSGNLYMNEAALTGESIPIPKFSVNEATQSNQFLDFELHKRHLLFEGTNVTSVSGQQSKALVLRTSFSTSKGQLLRSVICPQFQNQDLQISFVKYIGVAFVMLFLTFPFYWNQLHYGGFSNGFIMLQLIGALAQMIPPNLPVLLSMSLSGSIKRLSKFKIYSQKPQQLILGQDIQTMCFDKTGTITTDEIILKEVLDENFEVYQKFNNPKKVQQFNWFLGSCHSVQKVQQFKGNQVEYQLQGDNLELQMIEYSQSIVNQDGSITTADNKNINILKVYEFDSNVARMTVIVEIKCPEKNTETQYFIYTKGAPEVLVGQCCDKSKVPVDYESKLHQMSFQGYRTLAMAQKQITKQEAQEIINESPDRLQVEKNLIFQGLFGFINPLKPDAAEVIGNLTQGLYNCVIISGDNPLTTIACGLKVDLFNNNVKKDIKQLVLLDMDEENKFKPEIIDIEQLKNVNQIYEKFLIKNFQDMLQHEYFVTTGNFFKAFQERKLDFTEDQYLKMKQILVKKTKIFARQKPEQKAQIIELFQQNGVKCGMIGDGSNDCAAIKQADLGISYQFCDASFASPFQYQKNDLQVVPILIQDAKCCMSNIIDGFRLNNFSCVILYFALVICSIEITQLTDQQQQWLMTFTQAPVFMMLAFSKPLDHKKDLKRIQAINNFFNLDHVLNVFQVSFFSLLCFISGYFYLNGQDWHDQLDTNDKPDQGDNYINDPNALQSVMSIMAAYLNIFSYILLLHGKPLRQPIYRQYLLFCYLLFYIAMQFQLVLTVPDIVREKAQGFVELSFQFRISITFMCLGFSLCIFLSGLLINRKFGVLKNLRLFEQQCIKNQYYK